jgi:SAM-dependent methyltransferase
MSRPSKCPVCQSNLVTMFLKREQVPVHQNLVMKDQRSALEIPRGNLSLVVCEECGFVFNQAFEPSTLSYGEAYDNTQSFSPMFAEYLSRLAQHLVFEKGIQNCRIVEVGCGKGSFLRKLTELGGNIGYGFDPSYMGPATDLDGRLHFEKRYYGAECAETSADVIVCRHVIEHVPNPLDLLHTIRQTLANSPRARVFFETPGVEWILWNQVIWDFFYEHCSYFGADSLTTAFEAGGFKIESIQNVFGGQYLWLEATLSIEEPARVTRKPGLIPNLAKQFALSERKLKVVLGERLQALVARGKVALWGAGAKGVTLANLVDPGREWIACVVDLNPKKQGHYLPGTGHPIVGYQELAKYGVETAILMNPNYREENLGLLQESSLNVKLIDLMDLIRGVHETYYRYD